MAIPENLNSNFGFQPDFENLKQEILNPDFVKKFAQIQKKFPGKFLLQIDELKKMWPKIISEKNKKKFLQIYEQKVLQNFENILAQNPNFKFRELFDLLVIFDENDEGITPQILEKLLQKFFGKN